MAHSEAPPLLLPAAVSTDGALTPACAAHAGDHFRCPACGDPVARRQGPARRPHFAHLPGAACTAESALHACAKLAVAQALRRCLPGTAQTPLLRVPCDRCGDARPRPLALDYDRVCSEFRDSGGLVIDVALLKGARLIAAIEIVHTHAMSSGKMRRLDAPWIEVAALAAAACPLDLRAMRSRWPIQVPCGRCSHRRRQLDDRARALRAELSLPPVAHGALQSIIECWCCGREIAHAAAEPCPACGAEIPA